MFLQLARKGKNEFYRYLLTIIAVVVAALVGNAPLFLVIALKSGGDPRVLDSLQTEEGMDFRAIGMDPNLALFLILLSFVAALLVLLLFVSLIHGKPILSVITARERIDWSRVGFAFTFWFVLSLAMEGAAWALDPANYVFQLDWEIFLPLLLIAFFVLPLQTSFEEIMFRGYLLQGIGLMSGKRWLPLLVTSVIFGMLHVFNPEIEKFGLELMMTYYIGIGLFLGICTLMDDGLELALGMHAATNIYGATIVSFEGSALQTPTIWRMKEVDAGLMLLASLIFAGVFIFVAARKYGWKDWRKLYGPLDLRRETTTVGADGDEQGTH